MTGTVTRAARPAHACSPGISVHESPGDPDTGLPGPARYLALPDPGDYPPGTVWECGCGRRYVSEGAPYANAPGYVTFRPESLLARAWRKVTHR